MGVPEADAFEKEGCLLPDWIDGETPEGVLRAVTAGTLRQTCDGLTSGKGSDLSAGEELCATDLRNLTRGLTGAYRRMMGEAGESGLWVQPVIARCRFLDCHGSTLHLSSPQLLGVGDLWQCMGPVDGEVTRRSDTDFTIGSLTLSAEAWRLNAVIPSRQDTGMEQVAEVAVETTAVIDPVDASGTCEVSFVRKRDNAPVCRASLPGTSIGMSASTGVQRKRVMDLLSAGDRAWKVRGRFIPGESGMTVTVPAPAYDVSRSELMSGLRLSRPCPSDERERLLAAMMMPNRFEAAFGIRVGSSLVWGDVRPIAFPGYGASELFEPGSEEVSAEVEVLSAGGLVARRSVSGSGLSRTLRPVVIYPNPMASRMRVLFDDGEAKEIALHGCGMTAAGFTSGVFSGDAAGNAEAPEGDEAVYGRVFSGYVVSADAAEPRVPLRAVSVCGCGLSGLCEAVRSRSSWDFGKSHLYAFSGEGIFAVCFSGDKGYASATRIDRRAALHGGAVSPEGVYVPVEGGLAVVNGARVTGFLELPADAQKVAWDVERRLLLCEGVDGRLFWVSPSHEVSLVGEPGEIVWLAELEYAQAKGALMVEVDMKCTGFSGIVWVESVGTGLSGCSREVLTACGKTSVEGTLTHPLRFRCLIGRAGCRMRVRIEGQCSGEFEVAGARLYIR